MFQTEPKSEKNENTFHHIDNKFTRGAENISHLKEKKKVIR